jgi:hypothetical protein
MQQSCAFKTIEIFEMFLRVLQIFLAKNLVKSMRISTLDKVIYFTGKISGLYKTSLYYTKQGGDHRKRFHHFSGVAPTISMLQSRIVFFNVQVVQNHRNHRNRNFWRATQVRRKKKDGSTEQKSLSGSGLPDGIFSNQKSSFG